MAELTLTADQLNYVGQPLKDLVVDLRQNLENIAAGLRVDGFADDIEPVIAANPPFNVAEYRALVANLSDDELINARDTIIDQYRILRPVQVAAARPIKELIDYITLFRTKINEIKKNKIDLGYQEKVRAVFMKPEYANINLSADHITKGELMTLGRKFLGIRSDLNAISGPIGGSTNRKKKRRKTTRRKTKRRMIKGRKTKKRRN